MPLSSLSSTACSPPSAVPDSTSVVLGRKAERGCGRPRCCASLSAWLPSSRLHTAPSLAPPARLPSRPPHRLRLGRSPQACSPSASSAEPPGLFARCCASSRPLDAFLPHIRTEGCTPPLHAASKTKVDCPQPPARSPVPDGHLTHSGCFVLPPAQRPARDGLPPPHPALIRTPPSHKAGRHPPCSLTPQGLPACRPDPHRQHPACPDLEAHPASSDPKEGLATALRTKRQTTLPPAASDLDAGAGRHPSIARGKRHARPIVRGKGVRRHRKLTP